MAQKKASSLRVLQKMEQNQLVPQRTNIFMCECGKRYQNFPAIYLHFKRAHQMKISTKISQEPCTMEIQSNYRIFTFFYSHKEDTSAKLATELPENDSSNLPQKDPIQDVFAQFRAWYADSDSAAHEVDWTLWKLKNFIAGFNFEGKKSISLQIIKQIPNYFNGFMLENEQKITGSGLYRQTCHILLELGLWLNENNLSNLIVIPYDSPTTGCDC